MDFTALYREHAAPLTAYFLRRTGDPERAADLTAETFAAALAGVRRFDPSRGPARRLALRHRPQPAGGGAASRPGGDARPAPPRHGRLEPTPAALEKLVGLAEQESTARALDAALESLPAEQPAAHGDGDPHPGRRDGHRTELTLPVRRNVAVTTGTKAFVTELRS